MKKLHILAALLLGTVGVTANADPIHTSMNATFTIKPMLNTDSCEVVNTAQFDYGDMKSGETKTLNSSMGIKCSKAGIPLVITFGSSDFGDAKSGSDFTYSSDAGHYDWLVKLDSMKYGMTIQATQGLKAYDKKSQPAYDAKDYMNFDIATANKNSLKYIVTRSRTGVFTIPMIGVMTVRDFDSKNGGKAEKQTMSVPVSIAVGATNP